MIKYDKLESFLCLTAALIMILCITGCKKKDEFDTDPKYVLIESVDKLS